MITPNTTAKTPHDPGRFRLPDPPQREPDEMTQYDRLFKTGNSRYLALHLGRPETTLVEADRWIVADPSFNRARARRPDLLVAFGVDPALYEASNGYIISEQQKPPDFVLEVASESTAEIDVGEKRRDYAALGIPEYWRFDESGRYHGTRLAGERWWTGSMLPWTSRNCPGQLAGVLRGVEPVPALAERPVGIPRPGHGATHRHPGG
ncbi:MAG: Uma2 family endonuclease [Chloroflexota bacterium]|nr:Uma2 family endonuclease [Chloroflexota bacterium]